MIDDGPVGTFEEVLHKMRHENNESVPVILFQPNTNEMRRERNLLPPIASNRKYTLVLDLDETLIHFDEKEDGTSQFLIRPYAQYFLKQVAKYYEVVIFTAALQDYADYILDRMDTTHAITYRLYRQHTDFSNNVYQKDLSKIGRELSRTIIVDNNAENFQL
jgi:CTD small phosphatase-like protein 2